MLKKLVAHALGLLNEFPLVIFSKKNFFFKLWGIYRYLRLPRCGVLVGLRWPGGVRCNFFKI